MQCRRSLLAALALACCGVNEARAGGADYSFIPLTVETTLSKVAAQPIEIKLVDKTGQPVNGATITRVRLDMAPDGMAQHTAVARLAPTAVSGIYRLDAEYSMTGRWQLSLAAKVLGESETVVGRVVFNVAPAPEPK
jgi:hypothetical protein